MCVVVQQSQVTLVTCRGGFTKIAKRCCVAFAQQVKQGNPAPISLCAG
jgi:hypothetical protein